MKKNIFIGAGIFVGGLIAGAVSMLVYKNIKFGKQSKLHEESYNNLNDLFMTHPSDGGTAKTLFGTFTASPDLTETEEAVYEDWPDEIDMPDEDFSDFYTDEEA